MCYAHMSIKPLPLSNDGMTSATNNPIAIAMERHRAQLANDLKKREMMKKVLSVRKGLVHVQDCTSSDCDKALCKSTKRLIAQYRGHGCINHVSDSTTTTTTSNLGPGKAKCQVCSLWALVAGSTALAAH
ncbi:hypothetical protein SPRG_03937 [Saprolegnia parasitica CBS 223.65]|uniref:Uncharacterized protein n=1 Tax=Saprolegnia parasitica (strain CBS 223.65) TaxID=695850 RepID=A0A067CXS9_SAPPC|nr:hypothetical protein SPRG_03937 [Saprolegnia parasitica CBS 223.65]KDO31321.1 hypothetical protein SPRG_03937 [Saprolegnia parasitica CBS 223.65]|eukprot:XP_012197920.1 hypothetical protein SPRG_03937 [Saprolegnia parasitica CBS 223.65]